MKVLLLHLCLLLNDNTCLILVTRVCISIVRTVCMKFMYVFSCMSFHNSVYHFMGPDFKTFTKITLINKITIIVFTLTITLHHQTT